MAYGLAEQYREAKTDADQKAAPGKKRIASEAPGKKKSVAPDGTEYKKVRFEGEIKKWSEKQKAEVEFIDFIAANFSGNTVRVYESYKNAKGQYVYEDSNGKIQAAPNGVYIDSTGDIYLDLNTGNHGEGLVMNTFAHELYHHIERESPKKARKLAEFLVQELGYENVEIAVQRQIDKAQRAGHGVEYLMKENGISRTAAERLLYDRAFSDFVADSLETMFTKGNVVKTLQKLKGQDAGLFNMIKSFIDKWVKRMRQFYRSHSTISIEGDIVSHLKKFEQIQQMFAEALVDAGEYFQVSKGSDAKVKTEPMGVDEILAEGAVDKFVENPLAETGNMQYSHREYERRFFPGNVFPSGQTHTAVAEWANRKDTQTGDRRLVLYKGAYYQVGKFDDMDFGYLITKKYNEHDYKEELKEYGETDIEKSVQERIDRVDALYREADEYGNRRYHADSSGTEYRGEDLPVLPMDQDSSEGGRNSGQTERNRQDGLRDQRGARRESLEWTPQELYDKMLELDRKLVFADGRYATKLENQRDRYGRMIDEMKGWDKVLLSERTVDSVSNRSLLANAFEGAAQTDMEKQKIQEYRGKIDLMNGQEQKLRKLNQQIKELSFAKGKRDTAKIRALRDEATKTANRISIYDKQLLRLESSMPLQKEFEKSKTLLARNENPTRGEENSLGWGCYLTQNAKRCR